MKLLNLKNLSCCISLCVMIFSCNNHTGSNHNTGSKPPDTVRPKDSGKPGSIKVISPNEEYDQHKIDSIKMSKKKRR